MCNTFLPESLTDWEVRCVLRPGKLSPVNRRKSQRSPQESQQPLPAEREWPASAEVFATKSLAFPIDTKQAEYSPAPANNPAGS